MTAILAVLLASLSASAQPAAPPPVFSYGLALRLRPEIRMNPSLEREPELDEAEPADLYFVGSRFRANLGMDALGHVRVVGQIQDARRFGSEAASIADEATLDLHQGYLEIHDLASKRLDLRAGRFELAWGDQRMIGPGAWSDVGRSFDGGLVRMRPSKRTQVDVFGAWIRERRIISVRDQEGSAIPDDTTGDGVVGTFGSWKPRETHEIDLYVLARFDGPTTTPRQLERDRRIVSPGLRAAGSFGRLDYGIEGGVQLGKADGLCDDPCEIPTSPHNDHFAWAGAASLKYTLGLAWKPFLLAEFDIASGDGDPNDGNSEEFDDFYPSNHPIYGRMDLIGWSNMRDVRLGLGAAPTASLTAAADVHFLGLEQRHGDWTDAGGNFLDDDEYDLFFATSRNLGTEIDLSLTWATPFAPVKTSAGFGAFVPAQGAIERRGPATSWWGFLLVEATLEGSTAPPAEL